MVFKQIDRSLGWIEMKDNRKCIDCNKSRRSVIYTGTLLCEECFNKMVKRLRKIAGKSKIQIQEDVFMKDKLLKAKELLAETDMTIREIADKTGVKYQTVWYHANKIRKNQKAVPAKEEKTEARQQFRKIVDKHKALKEEHEALKQDHLDLQTERETWKNKQMRAFQLNQELESLRKNYDDLQLQHKRLQEDYWLEKEKHDTLLKYFQLLQRSV